MSWQIKHVTHESPETEKQEVLRFWSGDYVWATRSRIEAPWGDEAYGFAGAFEGEFVTLEEKRRTLERAGYRQVARLERQLKVGTDYYDLAMYEKKV